MKHLKALAMTLLFLLALPANAFAAEVPDSLVVENLNGQQRIVKTYELPPGTDPEALKEPSFEYDGFSYTWAYTTKEEHTFLESKDMTEKVTVETKSKIWTRFWSGCPRPFPMTMERSPVSSLWTIPQSPQKQRAIPPKAEK